MQLTRSMLLMSLLLASTSLLAESEIRFVRVEGPFVRVSAEQLRARVAEVADRGYFAVDLDEVRVAVEKMAWIRKAVVTREWPDTLRVRVEEYEPVAHWNGNQMIDRQGKIFDIGMQDPIRGLPQLSGPDEEFDAIVERYQFLDAALRGVGEEIAAFNKDARGSWDARLVGGTELLLGSRDFSLRVNRYLRVHDRIGVNPRRVDLRYPNGLAVLPAVTTEESSDAI